MTEKAFDATADDRISALLLDIARQGSYLSTQAYMTARKAYLISLSLAVLVSFIVCEMTFLILVRAHVANLDTVEGLMYVAMLSLPGGVILGVVSVWYIRIHDKPRLHDLQIWYEQFRATLAQETDLSVPKAHRGTTFDMLLRAISEVPTWQILAGGKGIGTRWVTWFALFAIAVNILMVPISLLIFGPTDLIIYAVFICIMSVVAWVEWRQKRRQQDEELAAVCREWTQRFEASRSQIEACIEGL
jgi:hypothetical protein